MTYILGVNAFHADASAVLVKDGEIIFGIEEERITRIKHASGFPINAIKECLNSSKLSISDINHIAINTKPKAQLLRKLIYTLLNRPKLSFLIQKLKTKRDKINLKKNLKLYFKDEIFKCKFHFIEHHKAHLASAFYASEFNKAAVISVDGFGDFSSVAYGIGEGNNIKIDGRVFFPYSLGIFYTAITQYLGFPNYGDEYKLMGLAPYGKAKFLKEMRKILYLKNNGKFKLNLEYFRHSKEKIPHQWTGGKPVLGQYYSNFMVKTFGPIRRANEEITQKHKDIASSAQKMYEEAFFNLLNKIHKKYKIDEICIAGGCGANSVANGKIASFTPFKKVFVQAAPGDAGGALGAALEVWHRLGNDRCPPMGPSYLGSKPKVDEIRDLLNSPNLTSRLNPNDFEVNFIGDRLFETEENFLKHIAKSISDGLVIGWFQGKMEWGPRALGNRSILGDPRRKDMKNILNIKIKKRESFRPFAPSVLQEQAKEWFIVDENQVEVPYMMKVYPIKEDKRSFIPSVCHVDGTGRLQTVNKIQNKRYYLLIKEFFKITGIPMILNTSFNENEPIVAKPIEAIECFLRTKIDILVLDNCIITRKNKIII